MRLTACAFLLLFSVPAIAATPCDDLAAALRRGDGGPSHLLRQLADKSGGAIRIAEEIAPVPPMYQVEGFENARLVPLGDGGAMAVVNRRGKQHCQQWTFFERRNGGVWRPRNPAMLRNGESLCGDSFAQAMQIGDVPVLVVEHDGAGRVTLEATPWQNRAWGASCRIEATFTPGHKAMLRVTQGSSHK